jgi:hypothetical protein
MSKMGLQPAIDVLSQHSSRVSTSVAYMDHLRAPKDTMKRLGACARAGAKAKAPSQTKVRVLLTRSKQLAIY